MPTMTERGVTLCYEEHGADYPLLFAPSGMHSVVEFWVRMPFNPIEALSDRFRVIAMDQRNAGRSFSPLDAAGLETYSADAVMLLDHLGIARSHIMGGCIGCSFCLGRIKRALERVSAAVLQNPIGLTASNRPLFQDRFEEQVKLLQAGDEEAEMIDDDCLFALEHGMPPTGRLGIVSDCLLMVLLDKPTNRQVLLFPQLRRQS